MSGTLQIAGRDISPASPPYVIAEMSGNHNGSLERALAIVDAAADAGADAIKLQTYTADTMTLDLRRAPFVVDDPHSLWAGRSLHELYALAHTPWDWHAPIMRRAVERGLACFSSPFDDTAVELLQSLDAPAYKIASFECIHLPLIRRVAATGKPMIISTGMATLAEIDDAVRAARQAGGAQLALLKCTSAYPAPPDSSDLRTIPFMRANFGCEVGLSDHTDGIGVAIAAVAQGATIIEKHLTLSRADGGVDSAFSLEPAELRQLVTEARRAQAALGDVRFGPSAADAPSLAYRRSIYVVRALRIGDVLTRENIRCVRPGGGLAPKHYDSVLGRRIGRDVDLGEPLTWDLIG